MCLIHTILLTVSCRCLSRFIETECFFSWIFLCALVVINTLWKQSIYEYFFPSNVQYSANTMKKILQSNILFVLLLMIGTGCILQILKNQLSNNDRFHQLIRKDSANDFGCSKRETADFKDPRSIEIPCKILEILGIQLKSVKSSKSLGNLWNPWNPVKILEIRWKSREYDNHVRNIL